MLPGSRTSEKAPWAAHKGQKACTLETSSREKAEPISMLGGTMQQIRCEIQALVAAGRRTCIRLQERSSTITVTR